VGGLTVGVCGIEVALGHEGERRHVCGGESRHLSPLLTTCPMSLLPGPKMAASQPTNLNHLLNFSLPPRQPHPPSTTCRRSRKTVTAHGVWNKEREFVIFFLSLFCILDLSHLTGFVNAQYRFVMNPNGDYTVHFADPDMSVPCRDHFEATHHRMLIVSFNGQTSCRSSYLDLRYWRLLPQHRSLRTIARPIALSACLPPLLHG